MRNKCYWICDGISLAMDVLTLIGITVCVALAVVLFSGGKETPGGTEPSSVRACGGVSTAYEVSEEVYREMIAAKTAPASYEAGLEMEARFIG